MRKRHLSVYAEREAVNIRKIMEFIILWNENLVKENEEIMNKYRHKNAKATALRLKSGSRNNSAADMGAK